MRIDVDESKRRAASQCVGGLLDQRDEHRVVALAGREPSPARTLTCIASPTFLE